jgi:hypothetical protein
MGEGTLHNKLKYEGTEKKLKNSVVLLLVESRRNPNEVNKTITTIL